ncbi:hypothetical protein BHM03_00020618 [Ensete ventricosum]|nr:hypothetical protein BHM03_00020618 [Ensete ventricosum]
MQREAQTSLKCIHRDTYLGGPGLVGPLLEQRSPKHVPLGDAIALPDGLKSFLTYDRGNVVTRLHNLKIPSRPSVCQGRRASKVYGHGRWGYKASERRFACPRRTDRHLTRKPTRDRDRAATSPDHESDLAHTGDLIRMDIWMLQESCAHRVWIHRFHLHLCALSTVSTGVGPTERVLNPPMPLLISQGKVLICDYRRLVYYDLVSEGLQHEEVFRAYDDFIAFAIVESIVSF